MNKLKPLSKKAKVFKLGDYIHYKGFRYKALYVGRHSETLEEMVIYQGQYKDKPVWTRPLKMFMSKIDVDEKKVPRFKYIGK